MDSDGNVSVTCGGMTRTSGSNQNSGTSNAQEEQKDRLDNLREKRRKKAKELENAQKEKIAERRAEKKAAEEAMTEMPDYTVSATGTDIKTVTQSVASESLGTSSATGTGASFDIKA
jgi:predicted phage gp36 major capsid-like protein